MKILLYTQKNWVIFHQSHKSKFILIFSRNKTLLSEIAEIPTNFCIHGSPVYTNCTFLCGHLKNLRNIRANLLTCLMKSYLLTTQFISQSFVSHMGYKPLVDHTWRLSTSTTMQTHSIRYLCYTSLACIILIFSIQ